MNSLMTPGRTTDFERLHEAASLIARHPDYPGKSHVEDLVLREIDELFHAGQLDGDQRGELHLVMGRCPIHGR